MLPGSLFRNGFSAVDFHTAEKAHILFRKHTPIGGVCALRESVLSKTAGKSKNTPRCGKGLLRIGSSSCWLTGSHHQLESGSSGS